MRERKVVKFNVNMYDDIKLKIIDMKPERDLVHYVWTRIVVLAGKVNLEGKLYMSKNIPYTVETLAIEFNRGFDPIKLALEVLIELEMIEITEDNIYRVINFAKHQNIKVKEKSTLNNKKENKNVDRVEEREDLKNEIHINEDKEEGYENELNPNEMKNVCNNDKGELEINNTSHGDINRSDNIINEKDNNNLQDRIPILLEVKKNRQGKKDTKKNFTIEVNDEEIEDNQLDWIHDEEIPLGKGEQIIAPWSF